MGAAVNAREGVEALVDAAYPDREARRRVDLFEATVREQATAAAYRAAAAEIEADANPHNERGAGVRWAADRLRARADQMGQQ